MWPAIIGAVGSIAGGLLSKKDSKQTQQSTNEPWEKVQPYLEGLYGSASNLAQTQFGQMPQAPQVAASMPYAEYFPWATSTAFNPDTRTMEGMQMALNYAQNYLPGMIDAQYQSYYDMLNAPNVAQNPYVNQMLGQQVGANTQAFGQNVGRFQDMFGSTLNDIGDSLTREWLPGIADNASVLANQYGGTRQGVAQGVAIGDATDALSEAVRTGMLGLSDYGSNAAQALSSNMANTQMGAYNTGMNAAQNAMQMAPQIAQLGLMPSQIYQGVGNQMDSFRQQQIDAERQRWDYEQNAQINQMKDAEQRAIQNYGLQMQGMQNQWMPLNMANSVYAGIPWNQTQTSSQPGNPVAGALGGAMTGYQIGSMFGGGGSSWAPTSGGQFGGGTIPGMGPFNYY